MKKSVRKVRVQLNITDQDIPLIFGLVSTDPDYKLSLRLNHKLDISLRNSAPLLLKESPQNEMYFARFSDNQGSPDTCIHLISNRSGKKFLLKSLKNIDYLLLVHDNTNTINISLLPGELRKIENVTAVFTLDFNSLKDKNRNFLLL